MFLLLVDLLERVGFLIAIAFLFSQSKWMRRYMDYENNPQNQWRFILLFSFFAVFGTYSGVTVSEFNYHAAPWIGDVSETAAIANTRTVGVVIAGLLGGVKPGILVGLIAGVHRYSLGGFVALSCMLAPILQGGIAGLMKESLQRRHRHISSAQLAFLVGFLAESLQMLLIVLLSYPKDQAIDLVSLIALPQIFSNSIGVALFFVLYMGIKNEEERIGAQHALRVLRIADKTLPEWTKPFPEAIARVVYILVQETNAIGAVFEMDGGEMGKEGETSKYFIEVPFQSGKRRIGTFRLCYRREVDLGVPSQLIKGLTQLFSQQFAMVENERQAQLLADAEIRALQSQMNPHFLFNVLNTVKSYIRTRPDEARQMITKLAKFLRQNMQASNDPLVYLEKELEHVDAYLNLIQARMGNRLEVQLQVDPSLLACKVPPFSIQPLVENAIVHGLKGLEYGKIVLSVERQEDKIKISVADNGKWVEPNHADQQDHMGFALANLKQRLQIHFGIENGVHIDKEEQGTKVSFWVRG